MSSDPTIRASIFIPIFIVMAVIIMCLTIALDCGKLDRKRLLEHVRTVGGGDWIVDPDTHESKFWWVDEQLPIENHLKELRKVNP